MQNNISKPKKIYTSQQFMPEKSNKISNLRFALSLDDKNIILNLDDKNINSDIESNEYTHLPIEKSILATEESILAIGESAPIIE